MVSNHFAMCGAHWSSASWNITYLIYNMTSEEHEIERSYDVIEGSYHGFLHCMKSLCHVS